jgi:uncharacterized membrane protein
MTLTEQTHQRPTSPQPDRNAFGERRLSESGREVNVGDQERAVSVAAGSILALLGLSRGSLPGLLVAGVGGALAYRGVTGHCHAYQALGVNTAQDQEQGGDSGQGIHVEQAFLVNRPQQDLYQFWRDFSNLPRIMTHLKSVGVGEDGRSHWVAKAPWLVGGEVEWDAEITHDEPNKAIGWRSLPGSDIDTTGRIQFTPAMGDRGTEVHVFMRYVPPAGRVGHWLSKLVVEEPRRQMRDDLRNFKRVMEIGEILTTDGQSHGTCSGRA